MYIFDIENKSLVKDILLENLKILGVRCRLPKKIKENEKENVYSNYQIFQKPLYLLKKCYTHRLDGTTIEIPEFLVDACSVIEKNIKTEGIFRKAGSTCKQKERKLELNQGKKVNNDYHVFDACSLVKLFFRELPQPIIPYTYHDIFLKCLLLSTYEKELDALMLACLLIPEENLATLAFFMEFLLKVSWHSDDNKMNVKNLAIILTPTLMPVNKGTKASKNLEMSHHFKVVEMLIENAERIGQVPEKIIENLISKNKKSKKKRRSGSITRMFTGLKKMVGSKGSGTPEWDDSVASTPDSLSSLGKRKNSDCSSKTDLSAKNVNLTNSKRTCLRHSLRDNLPSNVTVAPERERVRGRTSRLNLMRRCAIKKQKSQTHLSSGNGFEDSVKLETENLSSERKSNIAEQESEEIYFTDLFSIRKEEDCQNLSSENSTNLSDTEFITVHKSEYEEIKSRVSALEEDLEKLNKIHCVQTAYEKTLERSERLNDGSTEQLAKRLSRELKIRSSEHKIIRSPSARKIGSIRRRSKEIAESNFECKTNLKRGRPNTVQTGLPSPRLRTLSNENFSSVKKNPVTRSSTFREEWKSGEIFFSKEHPTQKLTPQGRPSVAEIRCQNAGMVLEKAKLFNSLNESNDSRTKVPRRQSVRLENLRRVNNAEKNLKKSLTRTRSLGSDKQPKTSPLLITEVQSKINRELRDVIYDVCTPQSHRQTRMETPSIKKPLMTRSPRSFARTPLSRMRSVPRSRATPLKALIEVGGTPHVGLRRSPRILARSINTPCRHRD